ncbi:MAG: transcriptional regulator NrdR [Solirubrobacterales bacterium]|jgi:transcriptional repressor NrdR
MRCPWCGHEDDKVVDSRPAEQGTTIRRRRECRSCGRRYTTFERIEELGLMVLKRDGTREPWDREKMVAGIRKAIVNRPVSGDEVAQVADRIETRLRRKGPEIASQQIGLEVLQHLQRLDHVAYIRFVSVYKDFQELTDFERELGGLAGKKETAKRRRR